MTGVFYTGREYTFNSYWRTFTWDYLAVAKFTQTLGFINSDGRYENSESYYEDRWENFYNVLTQYRELENTYDNLSDDDKPSYKVFVLLGRIFMYDHLTQVAECWGDIPFTEAGYLALTGDVSTALPAYDDDVEIFTTILSDLKDINTELAESTSLSTLTTSYLASQDFINGGDLTLWRRYCNSLRLRIAMLVADNGDLASTGQAAIKEMLADTSTYPMVENNSENIHVTPDTDGFNYGDEYKSGWESSTESGATNRASQAMIDALQDDSRMQVFFDANSAGNYVGIDTHDESSVQEPLFSLANSKNYYCAYDSATFSRNIYLPGNIITAAEVSFLKAEAYQKGYATGDAEAAFVEGLLQSTKMYYSFNATGTYRTALTAPSDSIIEAFATAKWTAAADKEEAIYTQEWLNFSFLQTTQSWSLIRRTGYPTLYFPTDNNASQVQDVPNRLKYPPSERNSNTANYQAVKSQDNYTDKLFWAK
jgi:hypothetical protein